MHHRSLIIQSFPAPPSHIPPFPLKLPATEDGVRPSNTQTTSTHNTRIPSPDIPSILSTIPRPLSRSRSGSLTSQPSSSSTASARLRKVLSASTINTHYHPLSLSPNRRRSEGTPIISTNPSHTKTPSSELAYLHKYTDSILTIGPKSLVLDRDRDYPALERVLEAQSSDDEDHLPMGLGIVWDGAVGDNSPGRQSQPIPVHREEETIGDQGDSDSSLDLHTPLPHLMLRHGLLSPNSKLLPQTSANLLHRHGSTITLVSNGPVKTKSGIIKDERDTLTRQIRHRDGRLLRGGIGLTTGLGWSDSEDEDAPSPLTRRLSSLNLSRRSSESSIYSTTTPLPSSTFLSLSSQRRLHPLSRSYSSGDILEAESYSSSYEDEEIDHTFEQSDHWAQWRLDGSSPPISRQPHRPQPQFRNRRNSQTHNTPLGARASTGSLTSTFSLAVNTPARGSEERSKTPSKLRKPGSRASIKSLGMGAGRRDSTESSSLSSGFSSNVGQQHSSGDNNNHSGGSNGNTPSSTSSVSSISMPITPKDVFDPASPPLLSSTRGMLLMNKDKSLPPLPAGRLKKKASGSLQRSIISNSNSTPTVTPTLDAPGKYAFSRTRTFSSASASVPSPPLNMTAGSSPIMSSAVNIKPNVRPLHLPRQMTRIAGDRPAVPVPSPTPSLRSAAGTSTDRNPPGIPTHSFPTSSTHRPVLLAHVSTSSALPSPVRPKPRTGTGMVYRTSSSGSSKMSSSIASVSGGGRSREGSGSFERFSGVPRAVAL